jgi:hypothetical protein
MDRTDRLLLEQQIRNLDGIQRTIVDMRSVLVRRMRRIVPAPAPVPVPAAINLIDAFRLAESDDETDIDDDDEWFEGGVARQRELAAIQLRADPEDRNAGLMQFLGLPLDEPQYQAARMRVREQTRQQLRNQAQAMTRQRIAEQARLSLPKTKSTVIKKQLLDQPLENVCGICLETHTKIESVVCNCTHEFGQRCLTTWIDTNQKNHREITCPSCRQRLTLVTSFRARAAPRPKVG